MGGKERNTPMKNILTLIALALALSVNAYALAPCASGTGFVECTKARLAENATNAKRGLSVTINTSGSAVASVVSPISGTITGMYAVLQSAMTGSATYTLKISGTAVTGASLILSTTIPASTGVVSATATANNVVAVGDVIVISGTSGLGSTGVPGIANTNAVFTVAISPSTF